MVKVTELTWIDADGVNSVKSYGADKCLVTFKKGGKDIFFVSAATMLNLIKKEPKK
jgi:hypothetical protein